MKKIAAFALVLMLALALAACSGATPNETATTAAPAPQQEPTSGSNPIQAFIDALSGSDIAAAKNAAAQYLKDSRNGVLSIVFDSEMRKPELWNAYGEGLGGDLNQPKFSPGNLAVFNVDTRRYGDVDVITLGRSGAGAGWEVLNYGR